MKLRFLARVVFRSIIALVFPAVISAVLSLVIAPGILILANCTSVAAQDVNSGTVAAKRAIIDRDLFDFVWVGDAQVSPDGGRVAFVRVSVNDKKEGYNTSIWMVSTSGTEAPHRLTSGDRDSSPRWSPDGKYLVFTRSTEKEGKPEPAQLCMLSMAGGDAFSFTSLPKGAGDPKWSPDGKLIVFTSSSNPEDLEKQEKKKRKEEEQKRASNSSPAPSPESARYWTQTRSACPVATPACARRSAGGAPRAARRYPPGSACARSAA